MRLLPDRYEVQEARIAVYKIADGLDAKPVRTFPAPRQVILLIPGSGRHAVSGWAGRVRDEHADRRDHGEDP